MIARPVGQQLSRVLGLVALLAAPAPTLAADLKIDWEQGFYPEEDQAITAVVAAYQQRTGKTVELNLYPEDDFAAKIVAKIDAGFGWPGSSNVAAPAENGKVTELPKP